MKNKDMLLKFGNHLRDNFYTNGSPDLIPYDKSKYKRGTVAEILEYWYKDFPLSLVDRHKKVMEERDIIISVYTNASGFLWSMCKVESGTDLGYSEYNGDCKASGSFTTYDKAFEDALLIAEKCTLEEFRKKSNYAHWSNYANFVRAL